MTSEDFIALLVLYGFTSGQNVHSDADWTSAELGIEVKQGRRSGKFYVDPVRTPSWSRPLNTDAACRRLRKLLDDPNVLPLEKR